jgi:hypothetical protein
MRITDRWGLFSPSRVIQAIQWGPWASVCTTKGGLIGSILHCAQAGPLHRIDGSELLSPLADQGRGSGS